MPIDSAIPLSYKPSTELMGPKDLLSLKDLGQRSQLNEMEIHKKQAMTQALSSPQAVDPQTGRLSLQAIGAVTQIDPMLGAQLGQQQETLRLRDLQINEKKQALSMRIGTSYVESYDRYLQQTGGNKLEAQRLAVADRNATIDELEKSGQFSSNGVSDPEIMRIRSTVRDPDQVRALVSAMGGKITEAKAPLSDIGKLGADLQAGRITQKDYEAEKAKKLAPTATMYASAPASPGTLRFNAEQYLAGDRSVMVGMGRNPKTLMALRDEIAKVATEKGMSPRDVAATMAEFEGIKAGERTLGTRTANIEMAVNEADQLADLALSSSSEWTRAGVKSVNDLQKAIQSRTASPALRQFVAANTSFINAYARAISPSGVPTVSDKEHAREMLDVGFSKGDYAAAIAQLKKEMQAAVRSPGMVRGSFREAVVGGKKDSPGPKVGEVQEGYRFKGGNPADHKNWEKE